MPSRRIVASLVVLVASVGPAFGQESPLRQVIDAEVKQAWVREKIQPSPRASDAVFVRRIHLDLIGSVPSYEEASKFLNDPDPSKRDKLIASLLDDPRFATHQSEVWDLILFGRNPGGGDATRTRPGFRQWLAGQFEKNVPYDEWVRELILAEKEGPELFHVQFRNNPEEATVAASRIFLGTQLQCARCHDHPYEAWTQKDFYGMAGFFVRNVVVENGKKFRIAEKSTGEVLFTGSVKEQKPGQKGTPVKAKFLGGDELVEPAVPKDFKEPVFKADKLPPPLFSRKAKLAEWLTSADNPYFARAVANRVWAQYLGRGLVHPIDDLTAKNKASHPALLDALTKFMVANKFDLKAYIRELVSSETYQLAATGPGTEALPHYFERARVRPLSAEEMLRSLRVATAFPADGFKGSGEPTEYFRMYFGEPTDGQGNFQGSLGEHLFLNNSGQVRQFAQARKGNLADTLLTMKGSWEEKVDRLFLSMLSRPPSTAERERFVKHLSSDAKAAPALVEDAVWVLMSCAEFRFNH